MARRVVVTGLGVITAIGTGKESFWEALRSSCSGVQRVDDLLDLTGIDVLIGSPVRDFNPCDYMDQRRARRIDRASQFALAATHLALSDAGIAPEMPLAEQTGVIVGTGIGGLQALEANCSALLNEGPRRVSPFFVPRFMPNAMAGEIAIEYGFRGPNFGVVSACASAAHAIGISAELIRSGFLNCVVTGGAEAVMQRITYAGFARMGALSRRNEQPERASRPFDRDRDGFVIGEGAGILVLEERTHAKTRGTHIYAELVGFGMSADATHITAPAEDGSGAAQAMMAALNQAGISPEQVDYINAHGTSTPLNDVAETRAIKRAFGDHAYRVKINSTKSQIGHLLGAAGGVEAIATLLSMEHGFIPATLNYEHRDPECDLDYSKESVKQPIHVALSNSFGFGGQNAALLFRTEEG
jgi:3-oxoacyl-[acyl-carrier-protein] synthase II